MWRIIMRAEELNTNCQETIDEIEWKEERFNEDFQRVWQVIETRSKFSRSWCRQGEKANQLRILLQIKDIKTRSWLCKKICLAILRALIEFIMNFLSTPSNAIPLENLRRLMNKTTMALENIKRVEGCNVFITKGGRNSALGEIKMSPSAEKTTVTANGECILYTANECTLTVRNAIDEIVDKHVKYEVSAILVDPQDNPVDLIIENSKNGFYKLKYFPTVEGHHKLFVEVNSNPVAGTPLNLVVKKRVSSVNVFGEGGDENGKFMKPWGVCCDGYGRIYVADRWNHRIQVFTEAGELLKSIGEHGKEPGKLNRPTGIAADKYMRIIVADKDNHRIQIFWSDGTYINHFGKFPTEDESLHYPWDVAVADVDGEVRIAVTEGKKHRVSLFSDSGLKLAVCNFNPEMDLDHPRGIAWKADGFFVVTDFNKHKIVLLDQKKLQPVSTLGSNSAMPGEFYRPQGVVVNNDGMMAVSDCKNKRIQVFRNGILEKIITDCFESPQGVAFHPNGSLIVVDAEKNKLQIFPSDKKLSPLVD